MTEQSMSVDPTVAQALPRPSSGDITELVKVDLDKRREQGIAKYGRTLQAHNGRDALVDAYQEAIDLCQYLRQAIEEGRDADVRAVLARQWLREGLISSGSGPVAPVFDADDRAIENRRGQWVVVDRKAYDEALRVLDGPGVTR